MSPALLTRALQLGMTNGKRLLSLSEAIQPFQLTKRVRGGEKNKLSLYETCLSVQITSKASLTCTSHHALLKHPQLYEVSTFQLVSIIYHCKVSKGFNTGSNHRI